MKKWYTEEYEWKIEVIGFLRGTQTERYCRNGEEISDSYTCTYTIKSWSNKHPQTPTAISA